MSRVGDPSSKYAYDYDGSQLERDVAEKQRLYEEAMAYIKPHIENVVYRSGLLPKTGMSAVMDVVREIYKKVHDLEVE